MASDRPRRLTRSQDRKVAGVCGGIAEYLDADPTLVRLAVAALALLTAFGPVALAYGLLWIITPESTEPAPVRAPRSGTDPSILIGAGLLAFAFLWLMTRGWLGMGMRGSMLGWGVIQLLWIAVIVVVGVFILSRARRGP